MHYRIHIQGHLASVWEDRFLGLRIEQQEAGTMLLVGTLPDQSVLYGVLLQLMRLSKDALIKDVFPGENYDNRRTQEKQ